MCSLINLIITDDARKSHFVQHEHWTSHLHDKHHILKYTVFFGTEADDELKEDGIKYSIRTDLRRVFYQ